MTQRSALEGVTKCSGAWRPWGSSLGWPAPKSRISQATHDVAIRSVSIFTFGNPAIIFPSPSAWGALPKICGRYLVRLRFHLSPFHCLAVIRQLHDHFVATDGDDHVAFQTVAKSTDPDHSPMLRLPHGFEPFSLLGRPQRVRRPSREGYGIRWRRGSGSNWDQRAVGGPRLAPGPVVVATGSLPVARYD